MVFNDSDGLYTYTFEAEKKVIHPSCLFFSNPTPLIKHLQSPAIKRTSQFFLLQEDCSACGRIPQRLTFSNDDTLQNLLDLLLESQLL
jgi:hypothetical protein